MAPPTSISPRLAEEFFEAVREYVRWSFSGAEPGTTIDRHLVQVSLVCGRVDSFTDPLPDEVFDALYVLAMDDTHRHLKEQLAADRTYATAARCFRELIEDKKRRYLEIKERHEDR